jgi:predicted outer membrane repeat protein
MRGKPERIVAGAVAAVTMIATGLLAAGIAPAQAAQAASAIVRVPCVVRALVLAMTDVSSGEELSLARNCTYVLAQGLPVVSEDLTILGNGATVERSYAPGTPAFIILESDAASLAVSSLNFRHGNGAIAMGHGGELTVNGGTFTGNTAADGGAISELVAGFNGPVVSDATFIANQATDSGGAIYDGDAAGAGVVVTNCTFIGNEAVNFGGAISDFAQGESVTGSVFRGNKGGYGGAMFLDPNGGAEVSHDVLEDNSSTGNGGAIYSQYGLNLDNSKFSDNHAADTGGGLYISPEGIGATLTDAEFTGNSATNGGAVGNLGLGNVDLTDVTISGNQASVFGGGIYNVSFVGAVNTQITRNVAGSGGGIYNVEGEDFTTPTLTNSSVIDNQPDNCAPLDSVPGCVG